MTNKRVLRSGQKYEWGYPGGPKVKLMSMDKNPNLVVVKFPGEHETKKVYRCHLLEEV